MHISLRVLHLRSSERSQLIRNFIYYLDLVITQYLKSGTFLDGCTHVAFEIFIRFSSVRPSKFSHLLISRIVFQNCVLLASPAPIFGRIARKFRGFRRYYFPVPKILPFALLGAKYIWNTCWVANLILKSYSNRVLFANLRRRGGPRYVIGAVTDFHSGNTPKKVNCKTPVRKTRFYPSKIQTYITFGRGLHLLVGSVFRQNFPTLSRFSRTFGWNNVSKCFLSQAASEIKRHLLRLGVNR